MHERLIKLYIVGLGLLGLLGVLTNAKETLNREKLLSGVRPYVRTMSMKIHCKEFDFPDYTR